MTVQSKWISKWTVSEPPARPWKDLEDELLAIVNAVLTIVALAVGTGLALKQMTTASAGGQDVPLVYWTGLPLSAALIVFVAGVAFLKIIRVFVHVVPPDCPMWLVRLTSFLLMLALGTLVGFISLVVMGTLELQTRF